jgi:hypothetical protein
MIYPTTLIDLVIPYFRTPCSSWVKGWSFSKGTLTIWTIDVRRTLRYRFVGDKVRTAFHVINALLGVAAIGQTYNRYVKGNYTNWQRVTISGKPFYTEGSGGDEVKGPGEFIGVPDKDPAFVGHLDRRKDGGFTLRLPKLQGPVKSPTVSVVRPVDDVSKEFAGLNRDVDKFREQLLEATTIIEWLVKRARFSDGDGWCPDCQHHRGKHAGLLQRDRVGCVLVGCGCKRHPDAIEPEIKINPITHEPVCEAGYATVRPGTRLGITDKDGKLYATIKVAERGTPFTIKVSPWRS